MTGSSWCAEMNHGGKQQGNNWKEGRRVGSNPAKFVLIGRDKTDSSKSYISSGGSEYSWDHWYSGREEVTLDQRPATKSTWALAHGFHIRKHFRKQGALSLALPSMQILNGFARALMVKCFPLPLAARSCDTRCESRFLAGRHIETADSPIYHTNKLRSRNAT